MENYIIYCHTNKLNGKRYIGQTKNSVQKRWGHNGYNYTRCPNSLLGKAILKYGWDNFEHEILFTNLTKEQANAKEIELIKLFNTTDRLYGYNLTAGGQMNTLTLAQKEQRRQLNYQMWQDGTFQAAVCTAVYCVELDTFFSSALEAQRQTGIDNSAIQKVCKKQLKYAGFSPVGQPLHWLYAEDVTEEAIQELYQRKEVLKGVKIPVQCITTGQIFLSTKEVEEQWGIDGSSIRKCIRGERHSAGKHPQTGEKLSWVERPDLLDAKGKIPLSIWNKF